MCDRNLLVEEAHLLAGHIQKSAHQPSEDSLLWFDSPPHIQQRERPIGPHLYSGTTGIALFLAAMEYVVGGDGQYRRASLRSIAPLRRSLSYLFHNPAKADQLDFKLGGMIGLGGYIYSFLRIGHWLNEPQLIEEAHAVATLITAERISGDGYLDVAHGSAGSLLSLLLLDSIGEGRSGARRPLELACVCGHHLLTNRLSVGGYPPAWLGNHGAVPLCGFSHGAAGIAYSLVRLFERTGDERFLKAAQEGLEFERSQYNPELKNWRDLRDPIHSRYMASWCHGAPGIALARMGMLKVIDDDQASDDLCNALETTRSEPLAATDSLCCGNMGRVEILLYAHTQLEDSRLCEDIESIVSRVFRRSLFHGGRYSWSDPCDYLHPSLFIGAAGIGYTWLRMLTPTLPSILLME